MDEPTYNRHQRRQITKIYGKPASRGQFDDVLGSDIPVSTKTGFLHEASLKADRAVTRTLVDNLKNLSTEVYENPQAFPYYNKIRKITVPHLLPAERYQSLSKELWNEYLEKSPDTQIPFIQLMYLATIISNIQSSVIVGNHLEDQQHECGGFLDAFALYASYKIALHYPGEVVVEKLHEVMDLIKDNFKDSVVWLFFLNFEKNLDAMSKAFDRVREVVESIHGEMPDCEDEMNELKLSADELWTSIRKFQRYTIKQSVFQASFGKNAQWAILDHRQIRVASSQNQTAERMRRQFESFAIFSRLTSSEAPESLKAQIVELKENKHEGTVMYGFHTEFDHDELFQLGNDGELYISAYPIKIPLRPLFKLINAEGAYYFSRMHCIARICDMVLPPIITDQLPPLEWIRKNIHSTHNAKGVAKSIIQEIFLPRIRRVRHTKEIQTAIDQERTECEKNEEVEKRTHRFLGRVGHPRTLPKGYKPHPNAKKWAREDGFYRELEDYETWCRPVDSPVSVVFKQKSYDD